MLTKEQIQEYQEIYQRVFGKAIDFEEAQGQGIALIEFMKLACKPTKENQNYN